MSNPIAPLRVAIVGAGRMAAVHARTLRTLSPQCLPVAVCDASRELADAFAATHGMAAYGSLTQMLALERPEIVHICTPHGAHFEAASEALEAGSHIYVEKPFVETRAQADALLALAARHRRLVCAGHQQLSDPTYDRLMLRARRVRPYLEAEARFHFDAPGARPGAPPRALMGHLLDVLPHPLYTLLDALERISPDEPVDLAYLSVTPEAIEATLRAGPVQGRLVVSLAARPVASTLSITGRFGSLAADFMRGSVNGTLNPGTTPIEKLSNPVLEGLGLGMRGAWGGVRRALAMGSYPGLAEMFRRFQHAVSTGAPSPVTPAHLRLVTSMFEEITAHVVATEASALPSARLIRTTVADDAPIVALTGAAGFLGRPLARALASNGFRVRGIGRGPDPLDPHIHEWRRVDLSAGPAPDALAGAQVLIHAAAASSGDFDTHRRDTVDSARLVIAAAASAGVRRVLLVSSLSTVRPPLVPRESLDELTPLADDARSLGPYTWGKCAAERLFVAHAAAAGLSVRVLRPAALLDGESPELPGLLGRRLWGRWYLAMGNPTLPFAAMPVGQAADLIAWCVQHFDDVPPVLHLLSPELHTRAHVIYWLRDRGWSGRPVWTPILALVLAAHTARTVLALARGRRPEPFALWQLLRPRRHDATQATRLLTRVRTESLAMVDERVTVAP